jgi:hypothetical protein
VLDVARGGLNIFLNNIVLACDFTRVVFVLLFCVGVDVSH